CGPGVDPELTRIASAVYSLEKRGIDVTRYNLANDPSEFIENKKVNHILNEKGADILPITILNGEIVKESSYPSNEELTAWLQIDTSELKDKPQARVEIDIDLYIRGGGNIHVSNIQTKRVCAYTLFVLYWKRWRW